MIHRKSISIFILLLAAGLLCLDAALAAPPVKVKVTAANPNSALQGDALPVVISGSGFDVGSTVKFLVTGTKDGNQISVSNVVLNPDGTLTASIQVQGTALAIDYDIEVRASSGRRGKGTTLFKVFENGGNGNQGTVGTADFSSDLSGILIGSFVDLSNFETLSAQLTGAETLTVTGNAGAQLIVEDNDSSVGILPSGVGFEPAGCEVSPPCHSVVFNSASPTEWTIRQDHDKEPADRIQFRLNWTNYIGEQHYLRVGWVVQGSNSPNGDDFGTLVGGTTLRGADIEFAADPYRIDGKLLTGRGKKTAEFIYWSYGEESTSASFDIVTLVP